VFESLPGGHPLTRLPSAMPRACPQDPLPGAGHVDDCDFSRRAGTGLRAFWAVASVAHQVGVAEDPRIVEMAAWERAIFLAWGLAALDWWWQWHRFRRGDW
jgi:hypothetical protein